MSYLDDLRPRNADDERPAGAGAWVGLHSGVITRDVAAVGDPVFVTIPHFGNTGFDEIEWGPCAWAPEWGEQNLPSRGDSALVAFDNRRIPWVVKWLPAVYVPPAGGGGSDVRYTHTQASSAAVWTITHNLGVRPAVMIVDNGDIVINAEIHYVSANQLTITFDDPQTGKAYLS